MTVNPSVARAAIREAMGATETTQQQFADRANQPESVVSDAMNRRGRNLDVDWILAQDPAFVLAFWRSVERQLELTPETRQAAKAELIAKFMRLILEVA